MNFLRRIFNSFRRSAKPKINIPRTPNDLSITRVYDSSYAPRIDGGSVSERKINKVRVINTPDQKRRQSRWEKLTDNEKRELGRLYSQQWEKWSEPLEEDRRTPQEIGRI